MLIAHKMGLHEPEMKEISRSTRPGFFPEKAEIVPRKKDFIIFYCQVRQVLDYYSFAISLHEILLRGVQLSFERRKCWYIYELHFVRELASNNVRTVLKNQLHCS